MTRPLISEGIHELAQRVRDLVNNRGHEGFPKVSWHKICASMDNLEDTSLALLSFERSGLGRAAPSQYLRLFGAMQAIFLQQDSIATLHRELLGAWKPPGPLTAWSKARELRNIVGGHPAERAGMVARVTLKSRKVLIAHWSSAHKDSIFEEVNVRGLVFDYLSEAVTILSMCVDAVAKKGMVSSK